MEITPTEAANKRVYLSEEYSTLSEKTAILESHGASFFLGNKEKYGTDKLTENAWKATDEGIAYTYGKARMKAIEKELSALKTFIEVKTNEARGFY